MHKSTGKRRQIAEILHSCETCGGSRHSGEQRRRLPRRWWIVWGSSQRRWWWGSCTCSYARRRYLLDTTCMQFRRACKTAGVSQGNPHWRPQAPAHRVRHGRKTCPLKRGGWGRTQAQPTQLPLTRVLLRPQHSVSQKKEKEKKSPQQGRHR